MSPIEVWSLRLLYQSTYLAVTYSTSAIVLNGPTWKGLFFDIALVLNKPIVDSARALSYASPTLPTEARIPSSISSSLNRNAKY